MPFWALMLRTFLFPLEIFYWQMSKARGYDWQKDIWQIHGSKFSGHMLIRLAKAQGETFKIYSVNGVTYLENVEQEQMELS